MKKNKFIIISSICIFLINFPSHFIYDIFPNKFISLFFPVNESIFEHLKMMFTSYIIFYIIWYFVDKDKTSNKTTFILTSSIFCILLFLAIYIPLSHLIGEVLLVTILLLFITIFISIKLMYFILELPNKNKLNLLSLICIILILLLNSYLTYNPPHKPLFYDNLNKIYGIKKS